MSYGLFDSIESVRVTHVLNCWVEYRYGHLSLQNFATHDQTWIFHDNQIWQQWWFKGRQVEKLVLKWNIYKRNKWYVLLVFSIGNCFGLATSRIKELSLLFRKKERKQTLRLSLWAPLQDNAQPHRETESIDFGKDFLKWEILVYPPYLIHVAPSNYHLFLSIEGFMNGKTFRDQAGLKDGPNHFPLMRSSFFLPVH